MANQYSITVGDVSNATLKELKRAGFKTSQVIDAAIFVLGADTLARITRWTREKRSDDVHDQGDEE